MAIRMAVPMATQRIEVITGREARRQYNDAEKLRLVEEAFAPGVRTADFARRHGVDQSLLYRWRRQFCGEQPRIPAFTPVAVMAQEERPAAEPAPPAPTEAAPAPGWIELELRDRVRVKIIGAVDPATLSATLTALAGWPT